MNIFKRRNREIQEIKLEFEALKAQFEQLRGEVHCKKHNYKMLKCEARKGLFSPSYHAFIFRCLHCGKMLEKRVEDLTEKEQKAAKTLGFC